MEFKIGQGICGTEYRILVAFLSNYWCKLLTAGIPDQSKAQSIGWVNRLIFLMMVPQWSEIVRPILDNFLKFNSFIYNIYYFLNNLIFNKFFYFIKKPLQISGAE